MTIPSFDDYINESSQYQFDFKGLSSFVKLENDNFKINLPIDPFFENIINENINELFIINEVEDIRDERDSGYTPGAIVKAGIATWLSGIVAWKLKQVVTPYVMTPQDYSQPYKWEFIKDTAGKIVNDDEGKKMMYRKYLGNTNKLKMGIRGKLAKKKISRFLTEFGKSSGRAWRFIKMKFTRHKKAAIIGLVLSIAAAAAAIYYNKVAKRRTLEYQRDQAIRLQQSKVEMKLAKKIEELKAEEEKFVIETQYKIEEAKRKAMEESDPEKLQAMIEAGWKADIDGYQ